MPILLTGRGLETMVSCCDFRMVALTVIMAIALIPVSIQKVSNERCWSNKPECEMRSGVKGVSSNYCWIRLVSSNYLGYVEN